jgi:hypothetical protein
MPTTIKNPADFAAALLGALGEPNNKTNVTNIEGWETAEGGNWDNTAAYNPLNTTQKEQGSSPISGNSSGVQAYTSWQEGLDATVQTLEAGNDGYPDILASLSDSAPWQDFATAVTNSSWGTKLTGDAAPVYSTPAEGSNQVGVNATDNSGAAANSPSKTAGAQKLTGFAGILQAIDTWYNPDVNSTVLGFLPNIPSDIEHTAILIFTRATSAVLSVGMLLIGVRLLVGGSSSSGGGSNNNVIEFVNNAKIQNEKLAQSSMRLETQKLKESAVATRHHEKLADNAATRQSRERVAATPRVGVRLSRSMSESYKEERKYSESHVHHHSHKESK